MSTSRSPKQLLNAIARANHPREDDPIEIYDDDTLERIRNAPTLSEVFSAIGRGELIAPHAPIPTEPAVSNDLPGDTRRPRLIDRIHNSRAYRERLAAGPKSRRKG